MEASAQGMRTLWISLAGLGTTAVLQAIVVALSGSVALLGDSIHNAADALTAVPLGIAFVAGRRAASCTTPRTSPARRSSTLTWTWPRRQARAAGTPCPRPPTSSRQCGGPA